MTIRPRRSALFMPGTNAKALEKARALPADVLILDCEDAVAPDEKPRARAAVAAALTAGGYGARELVLRVNGLESPWGRDDLAMAAKAAPHGVLLPKISAPMDVRRATNILDEFGAPRHTRLWIMLETPAAVLDANAILATAKDPAARLAVAVMGTNDLAKETRARLTPGRVGVLTHLAVCVAAARAQGVDILDGVYNDFRDAAGFEAECIQGRDLGMDGKTLIHPGQIAACNATFAPAADDIAWAEKIVAAFALPDNRSKGVVQIDGRMVERLHAEMAERTLAIAAAIDALHQIRP